MILVPIYIIISILICAFYTISSGHSDWGKSFKLFGVDPQKTLLCIYAKKGCKMIEYIIIFFAVIVALSCWFTGERIEALNWLQLAGILLIHNEMKKAKDTG